VPFHKEKGRCKKMRRFLLLGSLCLGGLIFAGADCGSNSKPQGPTTGSTGTTGPTGNTGTGTGPSADLVKVCKELAEPGLRELYCSRKPSEGGPIDLADENARMSMDWGAMGSYEGALEAEKKSCEEIKPNDTKEAFGCENPNLDKMRAYYKAIDEAANCNAVTRLRESETFKAICAGSNDNSVEVCKAFVEFFIRENTCNPNEPRFTEDDLQKNLELNLKKCETEAGFAEQVLADLLKDGQCKHMNLPLMKKCVEALSVLPCNAELWEKAWNNSCAAGKWCSN